MPVLNNARRERFCQYVAAGSTYVDAYKKAGYSGDTNAAPSGLAKQPEVRARIDELIAEHSNAMEQDRLMRERLREAKIEHEVLDQKWLLLEAMKNLEMARKKGQTSAANQALKMIGELTGHMKPDSKPNKGVPPVDAKPAPQRETKVSPLDLFNGEPGDEGSGESADEDTAGEG
mgnify:CR=1 FL=1|jgi:phage terminase small subunit